MSLALIPPNITKYRVVQSDDIAQFEERVAEFLEKGYIPHGELNIQRSCAHEEPHPRYTQVMVKQGLPNTETLGIIAKMLKAQNDSGMKVDPNISNIISQFVAKSQGR